MQKEQEIFEVKSHPIDRIISPNDSMYIPGQDVHYYSTGYSAIKNIQVGMLAAGLGHPRNILDMACGYGRVLRMLKAFFPMTHFTACDIDPDAVDFCAKTFGANKVYGDPDFERIDVLGEFDFIWCGSLLTHLDMPYWESFIKFCTSHLAHDGLLIFTTHGRYVATMIQEYDFYYGLEQSQAHKLVTDYNVTGFGYCNYTTDTAQSTYGISIAAPSWVVSFIEKFSTLQLCSIVEIGWDNHQDVYSCCYRQALIKKEIDDYAEKIIDDIMVKPKEFKTHSSPYEKHDILRWIETKINEDKMPFGPRIRHMLGSIILDKLNRKDRA